MDCYAHSSKRPTIQALTYMDLYKVHLDDLMAHVASRLQQLADLRHAPSPEQKRLPQQQLANNLDQWLLEAKHVLRFGSRDELHLQVQEIRLLHGLTLHCDNFSYT